MFITASSPTAVVKLSKSVGTAIVVRANSDPERDNRGGQKFVYYHIVFYYVKTVVFRRGPSRI